MKALKTIVAAGALGIFVFLAGFVLFAASIAGYSRDGLSGRGAPADAIVVLTGGEHRLAEGMRLFAEGSARRLLVSGVNRSTSRDDVRRIAGLAPELFDCCIDIGYGALDTIGNAAETRRWAETWGFSRLIVVTSSYHMPRSLTELGRALPGATLVPHAVAPRKSGTAALWARPAAMRRVAIEYLKFLPSAMRFAAARLLPAAQAAAPEGDRGH